MSLEDKKLELLNVIESLYTSYIQTTVPWNGRLWGDVSYYVGDHRLLYIYNKAVIEGGLPDDFFWFDYYGEEVPLTFDDVKDMMVAFADHIINCNKVYLYYTNLINSLTSEDQVTDDLLNSLWTLWPVAWIPEVDSEYS